MKDIAKGAGDLGQQLRTWRSARGGCDVEDMGDVKVIGPGAGRAARERERPSAGALACLPRMAQSKPNAAREKSPRRDTKNRVQGVGQYEQIGREHVHHAPAMEDRTNEAYPFAPGSSAPPPNTPQSTELQDGRSGVVARSWPSELERHDVLALSAEGRNEGDRYAAERAVHDERSSLGGSTSECAKSTRIALRLTAGAVSRAPWRPIRSSLSERHA